MNSKYFRNKPKLITILIIIACFTVGVRLLISFNYATSALLYIGIPFLVSLILIMVRDPREPETWQKYYLNRVIDAMIIMFGSSVILFEGYLCVMMFLPIYLSVITVMFLFKSYFEYAKKKGKGTLGMHILPLIIVVSAFEGITPELSYNRDEQVTITRVVNKNIAAIKNNLIKPIDLQSNSPWFLTLFPMPSVINAETLMPGDVHEIHFDYYRWYFTNLHQGRMLLEITEVESNKIKTTFLDDTSYIASYLDLKGTEITLDKVDESHTRITLTINYKRKLDPYWYFAPVERYGITKTAEFLITEVIAREYK